MARPAHAAGSSGGSGRDELTREDEAWLQQRQHRKLLDARVAVTGVAARDATDGHPLVLRCYPLREVEGGGRGAGTQRQRRDSRGGSAGKWAARQGMVPWPNLFWLVCPALTKRVGRLEHLGFVQQLQRHVASDEQGDLASSLARAHRDYGQERWAELSEADRTWVEQQEWGQTLRESGVAGLRYPNQVKCLHAHLAHHLAGRDNAVGKWVMEMLAKGEDERACGSAPNTAVGAISNAVV